MALTDEDKRWINQQMLELVQLSAVEFRRELEKVETRLLTEFHKWASPTESRQKRFSETLRDFEVQLEALDDRVKKLEGR